jgi:CubicO group peptidase (beta-lactamase class C family)
MPTVPIRGTCDPRFSRVGEVFAENFEAHGDTGGAVAVHANGRLVVDLCGGFVDRARTRPWAPDTLVNLASATKAFLAIAIHNLVDRGLFTLDAPVAKYWPAFERAGKDRISIAEVLGHRSGLAAIREPLPPDALYDWSAMTAALEAEAPWWTPGTAHGYHAMTLGWLLGEIVRRTTGKTFGRWFADEIASPLDLDLHVGLSPADQARVADVRGTRPQPGDGSFVDAVVHNPTSLTGRAFSNPQMVITPSILNSSAWRAGELPFANGHGTASALARLYGALADGSERLLSAASVARAGSEQAYGPDLVLRATTRFGLGFMLSHPAAPFGGDGDAFGHPGAGGCLGFADPRAGLGFGYVTCKMGLHVLVDPRATRLADAVYASL